MSNSRNDNRISGAKPFNSLDNNIVENVELSKIHQGMSSEPSLSSHENLKDSNCQQPSKVSSMTLEIFRRCFSSDLMLLSMLLKINSRVRNMNYYFSAGWIYK